jgi:glycine/D-amino acid oxidase-like deaminating enzyme
MQRDLKVNVLLLTPAELREMVPAVKIDDVELVAWEPEGGFANPAATVSAYLEVAGRGGAGIVCDAPVRAARREGGSWTVTYGPGETISARSVVLCTGNWSQPVGALFGVDLPVVPVRAQIVVLERPAGFSGLFPVVSDLVNLAYFRADGARGMWVGSSDSADLQEALPAPEDYDESAGADAVASAAMKASLRFDGMPYDGSPSVERAFAGLYETTPDWQPIVDSVGDDLHVAVGFSGHGFKLAPVVGEAMAARAVGAPSAPEFSIFSLSRFAQDRPIRSQYPYQRAKFLR